VEGAREEKDACCGAYPLAQHTIGAEQDDALVAPRWKNTIAPKSCTLRSQRITLHLRVSATTLQVKGAY
jgi:hypothetical protein